MDDTVSGAKCALTQVNYWEGLFSGSVHVKRDIALTRANTRIYPGGKKKVYGCSDNLLKIETKNIIIYRGIRIEHVPDGDSDTRMNSLFNFGMHIPKKGAYIETSVKFLDTEALQKFVDIAANLQEPVFNNVCVGISRFKKTDIMILINNMLCLPGSGDKISTAATSQCSSPHSQLEAGFTVARSDWNITKDTNTIRNIDPARDFYAHKLGSQHLTIIDSGHKRLNLLYPICMPEPTDAKVTSQGESSYALFLSSESEQRARSNTDIIHTKMLFNVQGINLNQICQDGFTALTKAAYNNQPDLVEALIASSADVNFRDAAGWTPLICAAFQGCTEVINILLESNADINLTDNKGWTPLHVVVGQGYVDLVDLLLKKRAVADTKDYEGWMPLLEGVSRALTNIVDLLLNSNVRVGEFNQNLWNPMLSACADGHVDIVNLLIKAGAKIDLRGFDKLTPLQAAVKYGHFDVSALLIDKGANVNDKTHDGFTVLHSSISEGYLDIASLLIEKGADINTKTNYGYGCTPLQVAVRYRNYEMVDLLIDKVTNIDLKLGEKTLIDYAYFKNESAIVSLLIKRSAEQGGTLWEEIKKDTRFFDNTPTLKNMCRLVVCENIKRNSKKLSLLLPPTLRRFCYLNTEINDNEWDHSDHRDHGYTIKSWRHESVYRYRQSSRGLAECVLNSSNRNKCIRRLCPDFEESPPSCKRQRSGDEWPCSR